MQLRKLVDAWPDVQIMGEPIATLPPEHVQQIAREYRDLWELSKKTGVDQPSAKLQCQCDHDGYAHKGYHQLGCPLW